MIYILGEPPNWLVNTIKELGEDIIIINDCGIPTRSVIISISRKCITKGSVILSLMPYEDSILIQRSTARGILSAVINLLKKINGIEHIEDALLMLGFAKTEVINAVSMTEIAIKDQVIPGSIYTITSLNMNQGKYVATLGRGTAKGTLILNSSITWLLSNNGEIYIAKGDLMLELTALSMIFNINLIYPNTPY